MLPVAATLHDDRASGGRAEVNERDNRPRIAHFRNQGAHVVGHTGAFQLGIKITQPRVQQAAFAAREQGAPHQLHERRGRRRVRVHHVIRQPFFRQRIISAKSLHLAPDTGEVTPERRLGEVGVFPFQIVHPFIPTEARAIVAALGPIPRFERADVPRRALPAIPTLGTIHRGILFLTIDGACVRVDGVGHRPPGAHVFLIPRHEQRVVETHERA